MRKLGAFKEFHFQELSDPVKAKAYIDVALEEYQNDNDDGALLLALRDVAEAQGGLGQLAEKTGLNRSNIYRTLSAGGNPRLHTLAAILHSMGLRLSVDFVSSDSQ